MDSAYPASGECLMAFKLSLRSVHVCICLIGCAATESSLPEGAPPDGAPPRGPPEAGGPGPDASPPRPAPSGVLCTGTATTETVSNVSTRFGGAAGVSVLQVTNAADSTFLTYY